MFVYKTVFMKKIFKNRDVLPYSHLKPLVFKFQWVASYHLVVYDAIRVEIRPKQTLRKATTQCISKMNKASVPFFKRSSLTPSRNYLSLNARLAISMVL